MAKTFRLPTLTCLRCGHTWIPRHPHEPKKCARCASPYWNKPKWKGVKILDDKQIKQHSTDQAHRYELKKIQKEASIHEDITYNYLKSSPGEWFTSAERLIAVAYRLESNRYSQDQRFADNSDIYSMFVGFALENYLKGAIVHKRLTNGQSLEKGKLDDDLNEHDICTLFSLAGLARERELYRSDLDYITECIRWRGRYPVPKQAKHIGDSITYYPAAKDGPLLDVITESIYAIPIDRIHHLVDVARKNLQFIMKERKV